MVHGSPLAAHQPLFASIGSGGQVSHVVEQLTAPQCHANSSMRSWAPALLTSPAGDVGWTSRSVPASLSDVLIANRSYRIASALIRVRVIYRARANL